ncbi:MAG: Response regulator of zinc sigma-54-dependent two-component system [Phycisphaerales bacterium]|nr:Response regulator of zinc sigma-54-dependent two-component system [Phycisphaerales bacterium]
MLSLNVLILDDEPNIRRLLAIALEADGHQVMAASNAADGIDTASRRSFDLAFVDLRLGTESGLDVIPKLLSQTPWTKVVVITAFAEVRTAVEAMRRGAFDYLPKPFTPSEVSRVVERVAELRQMEMQLDQLRAEAGRDGPTELVSRNAQAQRAFDLGRQVASSDATLLIHGESGTGKGVLAKAIHRWSARAARPFATVSTPSLSAELLESELFGHMKGAFTGATRDAPGRVAAANGGTLFLDEIGELPVALQPKLLRFLQDREYERVGDTVTRRADVRVIAATNVNLAEAVKAGQFREDLFFRLNVVQIEMPPLRQRAEDILPLAERMLASLSRSPIARIEPDAADALRAYAWPGNLRELHNAIERATILSSDGVVRRSGLPSAVVASGVAGEPSSSQLLSLDALEEMHIRRVLMMTKTLDEAAGILGIDVATLWRRRKRFGI